MCAAHRPKVSPRGRRSTSAERLAAFGGFIALLDGACFQSCDARVQSKARRRCGRAQPKGLGSTRAHASGSGRWARRPSRSEWSWQDPYVRVLIHAAAVEALRSLAWLDPAGRPNLGPLPNPSLRARLTPILPQSSEFYRLPRGPKLRALGVASAPPALCGAAVSNNTRFCCISREGPLCVGVGSRSRGLVTPRAPRFRTWV